MLFHQFKKPFSLSFVFSILIILMIFFSAFGFVVNASEPENNNSVVEPFGRPMISVILDGDYRGNRDAAEIAEQYGITVAFAPQGSVTGELSAMGTDLAEYPAGEGILADNSADILYAVWKGTFTLTFDPNGGELVSGERSYSIMKGQSFADVIAAFPVAERTGYKFSGFFDAEGTRYSTKSYVFNGDEDLTLYAQWTPTTHKVYFDANGGTGGSTQKTKVYDTPLLLNNILPTRAGYNFVGWSSDPNAYKAEYKKGDYITDESITQLYAIWSKDYKLTFDTNGGDFVIGRSTYSVRRGQKYKEIMPALPVLEREGYDFLGFFYEDGTRFGSLYKIFERQEDLTVYAKWTPHKYSITFDANGGEGAPALTYKVHDARRTLSAEIPHKDGYIFLGWGLTPDAESAVYQPRGSYTLNEDVTLYAVWGIPHTLTFDARDGTMPEGYPSEVTVANGSSYATTTGLKRLPTPTREDYDFIGWFSNDGYRLSSVSTPIPFDQDTVVIASWRRAAITHNVENPLVRQYMATTDYSTDPAYEKSTLTVDSQGNDAGGFYAQSPYYRTQYTYEKDGFARSDPMPLVLEYEGIILDETYFLAVNGKEWLSTQFEIGGSKVYVNNLIPGETYRCQLWFRKIEDGTERSSIAPVGEVRMVIADGQVRMIRVPSDTATNGIHNVRDLGGWTTSDGSQRVKYGLVYRSTELDGTNGFGQIDEAGLALLTQLGIKNEIDLDGGTTTNGCKLPNYEKIQVVAYSAGFTHKLKGNYGTVLSRIADAAEQGEGTLFHCLAGKDRTGTVAFLLLNILGIDENQIAMDYELTFLNNNVVSKHASLVTRNEMKWGSADNPSTQSLYRDMVFYIMNDTTLEGNNLSEKVIDFAKKNLGVTDELVGRLRTVLLEDVN